MDPDIIIAAIDEASACFGLKPTTIGQNAVRNGRLYGNLMAGGAIHRPVAKRLLDWIADEKVKRGVE